MEESNPQHFTANDSASGEGIPVAIASPDVPVASTVVPLHKVPEADRLFSELAVMFRYAVEEGIDMDDSTRKSVAGALIAQSSDDAAVLPQILAAHNALAKIIAPVTPISLQATEPAWGWLGSLRRPPLVLAMIVIAIISILGFVLTCLASPVPTKVDPNEKKTVVVPYAGRHISVVLASFIAMVDTTKPLFGVSPDAPAWLRHLNWFFAAALGAVFYVLFTVHEFVKKRTFDPRYNSVYVVRFVLGLVSGMILANVMSSPGLSANESVKNLGPSIAALLGGFSTEAVYQVLQRLVEVMLAAVRGDNSSVAKAKAADAARTELLNVAAAQGTPPQIASKLQAAAKKVGK